MHSLVLLPRGFSLDSFAPTSFVYPSQDIFSTTFLAALFHFHRPVYFCDKGKPQSARVRQTVLAEHLFPGMAPIVVIRVVYAENMVAED